MTSQGYEPDETEQTDGTEQTGERPPLAIAYGGGGLFGIAYLMGVAQALIDGGIVLRDVSAIGTSAGSWAAALVALGISWDTAVSALDDDISRIPDPRRGRLRSVAERVFGEARVPTMRAVVCDLPRLRRHALSGADHAVADLVSASSAVPGMLAPHRINGTLYVDGGVRSMASPDLADPADNLLVMAPMAGPMFGPAGRIMEGVLRREMRSWRTANPGGRLWLIRPNDEISRLARRPMQLFDIERADDCYPRAYEQGAGICHRWIEAYGDRDGPEADPGFR